MTQIVERLADIPNRYDALFCDLWGCLHNGVAPFPDAVSALQGFRQRGGAVILLTNAPRQRAVVERQLDAMGVPRDAWDAVATSGDSARAAMFTGAVGRKVWFMGEPSDRVVFDPMQIIDNPVAITPVPLAEAEGIVCTGPFDPFADPDTLRPQLLLAKTRGLPLLCANPDVVVDRGETRIWCAGAVAALYTAMGGQSFYFGKPYPPVYDLARLRLAALGRTVDDRRILAVGDGISTDIAGAMGEDLDSLFITGGLAAAETATSHQPAPDALADFLGRHMLSPTFAIGKLR